VLRDTRTVRGVSSTPRDIARDISIVSDKEAPSSSANYHSDPLRRTRKGRVNPLPQSKRQLKKARQAKARNNQQQANTIIKLANMREENISNLKKK